MAIESESTLIATLAQGEFSRLLGTPESEWLDFKEKFYNLDSPKGRRDLVADCAMFANGRGGIILCGVREELDERLNSPVAKEIRTIKRESVDEGRLRDLIRANIRPLLRVELQWYSDDRRNLLAIIVEPQPEHLRPFLVGRVAADDDAPDLAHAVGLPIRDGAATHWESLERIQQLAADGLRYRRSAVTDEEARSLAPRAAVADEHRVAVETWSDWQVWPWYAISALPLGPHDARIEDFFGGFRERANQWSPLRSAGFGLGLEWGELEIEAGELRSHDSRRSVQIARSGVVTGTAVGSPNFLGWASPQPHAWSDLESVITNPWVIVEFTLELVRLTFDLIEMELAPDSWILRASGHHLQGGDGRPSLSLRLGTGPHFLAMSARQPVADSFDEEVEVRRGETYARATYKILTEVFGSGWGIKREDIPLVREGSVNLDEFA